MSPLLPEETRLQLRQQRYDAQAAKQAMWVLANPDIRVERVIAVDGGKPAGGMRLTPARWPGYHPAHIYKEEHGWWYDYGAMEWDGQFVTVIGRQAGRNARWEPDHTGLLAGFDAAEAFQAGARPTTSGTSPNRLAAIATVRVAGYSAARIVFLDEESRQLAWIPAMGFAEEDLMRFAAAVGIAYRSYAFTLAKYSSAQVLPSTLCKALFPRSARQVRVFWEVAEGVNAWY